MTGAQNGAQLEDKSRLRRFMRTRIAQMHPLERVQADHSVSRNLSDLAATTHATFVLGYLALPDEVRVDEFLAAMVVRGLPVLLPRVLEGQLHWAPWTPCSTMIRDAEGVLSPKTFPMEQVPSGAGLVVVPGRAFDLQGRRLGRGGGYYDRLLSRMGLEPLIVGAAYACQVVSEVPHDVHDHDVQRLVTETAITACRSEKIGAGR